MTWPQLLTCDIALAASTWQYGNINNVAPNIATMYREDGTGTDLALEAMVCRYS